MHMRLWTRFITTLRSSEWIRTAAWMLFYLAIIAGLIVMYGKGDFSTPHFVYQGF
jgi:hypothetical protein